MFTLPDRSSRQIFCRQTSLADLLARTTDEATHCGRGAWMIPGNMLLSHMCYCIEYGHFKSNRFCVGRSPKNLGTLGSRPFWYGDVAGWPPRNVLFLTLCYRAKFGHRSNRSCVIMEISRKILTPHTSPFKVLNVSGTDTDRSAAYDFLISDP